MISFKLNEINFKGIKKEIQKQLLNNLSVLVPIKNISNLYVDTKYSLGSCSIGNNEYIFEINKSNNYKKNSLKINNIN